MQKETLVNLLSDVCGDTGSGGLFEIGDGNQATVLLATGGPLFSIEAVNQIEVKSGYAIIKAGKKDEIFLIGLESLIGLKFLREKKEGAGFLG